MKLEETIRFYDLHVPRKRYLEHDHDLHNIPAKDLFGIIKDHGFPLDKRESRVIYDDGAFILPLNCSLPKHFYADATQYEFAGKEEKGDVTLVFYTEKFGGLSLRYAYDGRSREHEASCNERILEAMKALQDMYAGEIAEEKIQEEEKRKRDLADLPHYDSWGGSDF